MKVKYRVTFDVVGEDAITTVRNLLKSTLPRIFKDVDPRTVHVRKVNTPQRKEVPK